MYKRQTPGSGKSFSAKREITNAFLATDDDIIVCDPESEYTPLVTRMGGQVDVYKRQAWVCYLRDWQQEHGKRGKDGKVFIDTLMLPPCLLYTSAMDRK